MVHEPEAAAASTAEEAAPASGRAGPGRRCRGSGRRPSPSSIEVWRLSRRHHEAAMPATDAARARTARERAGRSAGGRAAERARPGRAPPGRIGRPATARRPRAAPAGRERGADGEGGQPAAPAAARPAGRGDPPRPRPERRGGAPREAARSELALREADGPQGAARGPERRKAIGRGPHAGGPAAARQVAVVRALRQDPALAAKLVAARLRPGQRAANRQPRQGRGGRGRADAGACAHDDVVRVADLGTRRGPAPEARLLYTRSRTRRRRRLSARTARSRAAEAMTTMLRFGTSAHRRTAPRKDPST